MASNASTSPTTTLASPATSLSRPAPPTSAKSTRLPAPTLFVGPPSRNASQLSVVRTTTYDSTTRPNRDPVNRGKSALSRPLHADADQRGGDDQAPAMRTTSDPTALTKASDREVEKRWKEMQSTLNEVELTAQSSTHVFSERHAAALDELRNAQIKLAHAWGRGHHGTGPMTTSTADAAADIAGPAEQEGSAAGSTTSDIHRFAGAEALAKDRRNANRARADTASSASTALSDESSRSDILSQRSQLENETAHDIKLAGERRGANEAYFKKVDSNVRDVVAKLEAVAEAMRGVEGESRSLWSSSSSGGGDGSLHLEERASAVG